MKNIKNTIYGKDKGDSINNFNKGLSEIKTEYEDFIKSNNIDFDKSYILDYSARHVLLNITNQSVLNSDLGKSMRKLYSECFDELFK
jgi:hypothetical protein